VAVPPHVLEFSSDAATAVPALDALYHAAPATNAPPTLRYALNRLGADTYIATSPSRPPFGPTSFGDAWAFIEWRAIEDILNDPGPETVFVHAGGVRIGGRLVLLVGASGSGKSMLTALFLERGHPALGDDVLRFAPPEGVFSAVPRSLKLDANAFHLLTLETRTKALSSIGTLLAAGSHYVSPAALCPAWESQPGRPWAVVVLESAPHRGSAELERYSEGEAAVRLVQSMLGAEFGPGAEARTEASLKLLESLGEAAAFRARGARPSALADLIEEVVRT
jgi:hypothetical protein